MTMPFDFIHPWALLLAPLALLPLLPRHGDRLVFSCVAWLPADRVGRACQVILRACAVAAMLGIIIGLAGPGRSNLQVARTGSGAETVILMDRSASMNDVIGRKNFDSNADSKNKVAREALARFVAQRPHDRLAFMMFGISPILAVPFTYNHRIIQDAIAGTRIARGTPDTQLDRGLVAAIEQFEGSDYTGHRAIVLVSDGGARLDAEARRRIKAGLARNHIALYFIYLRSSAFSPDLNTATPTEGNSAEVALHRYFMALGTPYHLYQAANADAMAAAMAEINRQQNIPVAFVERLPRQDRSPYCFAAALGCCGVLLALRFFQVRRWV